MADQPDIILIMTDTQGANVIGCYGRPELKTPNIDRMAEEGIRFEKGYTCCPVCGPARSAIFTGTYPHTNGVLANNIPLGKNIYTIGQRLKDNGYHTAYIGKYHLDGTDYFDSGECPPGWDPEYWYDGRNYLDELSKEEKLRWRRELHDPDKIHEYNITEEFTWAHRSTDRAVDFLKKRGPDQPVFLVVSYDEPHGPCTCPPPYCDMFEDFEYELDKNVHDDLEDKPAHHREWAGGGILPHEQNTLKRQMYFGANSFVDYEIGRVLNAAQEYAPQALSIFTSDHGTPLKSHGLSSKGPAMYEETCRIPYIIKWPETVSPGSVCTEPVSHINIVPTFLEAAGIEVPPFIEGKSIQGLLKKNEKMPQDEIYMEFTRYEVNHDGWGGFQPIRSVFNGRFKLAINLLYTDELYDLQEDPGEMNNLINEQKYSQKRDELHNRTLEWMDKTRDPFRGPAWERRPWRNKRKQTWKGSGMTRPRPDDGYSKRVLLYETGLPVEKWEYEK